MTQAVRQCGEDRAEDEPVLIVRKQIPSSLGSEQRNEQSEPLRWECLVIRRGHISIISSN